MTERLIAVIGEAIVDLVPPASGAAPVAHAGGSPFNVAIGLARLGRPTVFAGRLSTDEYGTMLRAHARDAGVDLGYVVAATEPSTTAEVQLTADGVAEYVFPTSGTADFQWRPDELDRIPHSVGHIHFGSLASWLDPGARVIDDYLASRTAPGTISYDPNVRPHLLPDHAAAVAVVERSVRHADMVKASSDDLDWLYPGVGLLDVARGWLALGPALVVVTDGGRGSVGVHRDLEPVARPACEVEVADTVGAGDAFTAGLIDALARRDLLNRDGLDSIERQQLADVLAEASVVAALTCTRPGAEPPTRAELAEFTGVR